MTRSVEETVRSLAAGAVRGEGMDLVDLEFRREPAGWVLRLFVEKPEGVGLNDCQRISEVVGTLLEVEDPIPHPYTLEVSSPGLTRPLRRDEDWERALGKLVKVITRQAVAGRQDITGRLKEVRAETLVLDVGGTATEVPRELVARARMEIEWPRSGGSQENSRRQRRPSGE